MEFHALCEIFPELSQEDLDLLAADIRSNGLLQPIMTYQGKILDGRNRYIACQIAKVEPEFKTFLGIDPVSYILSQNLHRRHLDTSQRAMVAARLANLAHGRPPNNAQEQALSQRDAAEQLHVSRSSVQAAKIVIDKDVPEITQAVDAGRMSVTAAKQKVQDDKPQRAPRDGNQPKNMRSTPEYKEQLAKLKYDWGSSCEEAQEDFYNWIKGDFE